MEPLTVLRKMSTTGLPVQYTVWNGRNEGPRPISCNFPGVNLGDRVPIMVAQARGRWAESQCQHWVEIPTSVLYSGNDLTHIH